MKLRWLVKKYPATWPKWADNGLGGSILIDVPAREERVLQYWVSNREFGDGFWKDVEEEIMEVSVE